MLIILYKFFAFRLKNLYNYGMKDNNSKGLLNKESTEVELDKSITKIVVLAVASLVFSFLLSYFLRQFILNGQFNFLLFSFLAALIFLSVFLLMTLFIKSAWRANLIIFFNVLVLAMPFYDRLSKNVSIGLFVSFLIFIWANYAGRQELKNMLKIKFWRISKKTIPKAIVALAVFVGFIYAGVISAQTNGFFISRTTFEKIISPLSKSGLVQKFFPGFDLSLPTGELIQNLAVNQLEQNSQLNLLPESAKKQLINESIEDLRNEISSFTGSPLDTKTTALDELYNMVAAKFSALSPSVASVIPIVVAALIFLVIVGLSFPIRLLVSILAFLLYEICLALGFSVIMVEGRSREIIILK